MTLFLAAVKTLVLALLGATQLVFSTGVATRFGDPGDPLDGNHLSCEPRRMRKGEMVCAHRTLPCGTPVVVQNLRTGLIALCRVMDRGPYGATLATGEWTLKIRGRDPGKWRGIVDLSPAVARAIALNGREKVRLLHPKSPRRGTRPLVRQRAPSTLAAASRH